MVDLIPDRSGPAAPWGGEAPPAPASATRRDVRRVRSAFRSWSHFRPIYFRDADTVHAEIDLKGACWHGSGQGATESEAAWNALQDCIANWEDDIAVNLVPRFLRRGPSDRSSPDEHGKRKR